MKILKITPVQSYIVKTDDKEWPYYRTDGKGNWENQIGESWEGIYDVDDELEKAVSEFLS
jgi:hypothetical protein